MDDNKSTAEGELNTSSLRITLGTLMFYAPFLMFFGAPIVIPFLGLSATETAGILGAVLVVAEVVWFASIPLLGKEGFRAMKTKAFGFFKLRSEPISRLRHRLGVGLLRGSIVTEIIWVARIIGAHFKLGSEPANVLILGMNFEAQAIFYVTIEILTGVGVVAGVYMLGAGFAERLKHAFEWQPLHHNRALE